MRIAWLALPLPLLACAHVAPADVTVSTPTVTTTPSPQTSRAVDVAGLHAALASGARLIDVRTAEEFADGHVPGALNLPIDQLDARIGELSTDIDVYVICQSGRRSARAVATLAAAGLRPVDVTGGTSAWLAAGYPAE